MATNPYINRVDIQRGGTTETLINIGDTTAVASDVAQGKYFYLASGEKVAGTSSGGGTEAGMVTQDANGFLVLDDDAPSGRVTVEALSVTQNGTYTAPTGKAYSPVTVNVSGGGGGLEYETGTWTPAEDVADYTISFANTHSTPPAYFSVINNADEFDETLNSNIALNYANWKRMLGADIHVSSDSARSALAVYAYRSTSATSVNSGTTNVTAEKSDSWATSTGIRAYGGSASRYWRSACTYKWIAVWAPTS